MQSQLTAGLSMGGLVTFVAFSAWSARAEGGLRPYRLGSKKFCFEDEGFMERGLRTWLNC